MDTLTNAQAIAKLNAMRISVELSHEALCSIHRELHEKELSLGELDASAAASEEVMESIARADSLNQIEDILVNRLGE